MDTLHTKANDLGATLARIDARLERIEAALEPGTLASLKQVHDLAEQAPKLLAVATA